jgi:hypothetical protein
VCLLAPLFVGTPEKKERVGSYHVHSRCIPRGSCSPAQLCPPSQIKLVKLQLLFRRPSHTALPSVHILLLLLFFFFELHTYSCPFLFQLIAVTQRTMLQICFSLSEKKKNRAKMRLSNSLRSSVQATPFFRVLKRSHTPSFFFFGGGRGGRVEGGSSHHEISLCVLPPSCINYTTRPHKNAKEREKK